MIRLDPHQLKALLDSAPDAMIVADEEGTIVFANGLAEALFGYSRAELIGEPLETLLPERLRKRHIAHRAACGAAPRSRPMGTGLVLHARRKNGSEIPVEISLSPVTVGNARLISSAIRDVEAGAIKPDIGDCAVQAIFDRLRTELAESPAAQRLHLVVEPSRDIARSDPSLLQQIVQSLVAHALRSTRERHVLLRCIGQRDRLRIEVVDFGVGISDDELSSIFEESNGPARSADRSADGFGLAIAQRLASLLGHTVDIESTAGAGSRFAVNVPRGASPLAPPRLRRPRSSGTEERVVLVVDDEPAVLDATALRLELSGFQPVAATTVTQAESRLRELGRPPDLVLCDFRLGRRESGVDAIRQIRAAVGRDVPAILMSGDRSFAIYAALRALDDCEHLAKPIDGDRMVELIGQMLDRTPRS